MSGVHGILSFLMEIPCSMAYASCSDKICSRSRIVITSSHTESQKEVCSVIQNLFDVKMTVKGQSDETPERVKNFELCVEFKKEVFYR